MIAQIDVENFALFKKSRMIFDQGFNVLTGESGAGKSLALESVVGLFGGRLSQDRIGPWGDQVRLRASLHVPPDDDRWGPLEGVGVERDSLMIVERQTGRDGRSLYRVQGQPVPAQLVRDLGDSLLQYVGQNQLSKIFGRTYFLDWIDGYGNLEPLAEACKAAFGTYRRAMSALRQLEKGGIAMGELEEKRQIRDELRALDIKPGEDTLLARELSRLRSGRTLMETGQDLYARLDGTQAELGLLSQTDEALHLAQALARLDPSLDNLSRIMGDALQAVGEARLEITDWMERIDLNPERLEELEARADALSRVKRRYGPELQDVMDYLKSLDSEIARLENLDWELAQARRQCDDAEAQLGEAASHLSLGRRALLEKAAGELTQQIQALEMPTGRVVIDWAGEEVSERGIDALDVMFSAGAGQALKLLSKVASGGELARVALALAVMGRSRADIILMFDEVDQGLGGASAEQVGQLLRRLGSRGQVLAVSHQAVVAAQAHHQLRVHKALHGGMSESGATVVQGASRVEEIARMLSGSSHEVALRHAQALLDTGS